MCALQTLALGMERMVVQGVACNIQGLEHPPSSNELFCFDVTCKDLHILVQLPGAQKRCVHGLS